MRRREEVIRRWREKRKVSGESEKVRRRWRTKGEGEDRRG